MIHFSWTVVAKSLPFRTLVGLLIVGVVFGITPAAPVPPERRQSPPYFATTAKTKLVYQVNDDREYIEVITKVVPALGGATISVGTLGPDGIVYPMYKCVISERGLLRTRTLRLKEPLQERSEWILKLPYKVGETWETGGEKEFPNAPNPNEKWTHTSDGEEEVKVPAGTFQALRVTSKGQGIPGGDLPPSGPYTVWYAPRVGVVKIKEEKTVWVLKSFERGKE